jgi:hypothetical protein
MLGLNTTLAIWGILAAVAAAFMIFVISIQSEEEKRTSSLQGGASFILWITGILGVVAWPCSFSHGAKAPAEALHTSRWP